MATTLPREARVSLDPFDLNDGLAGLVQGIHAAMKPAPVSLDELLLMSGAAFKNYVAESLGDVSSDQAKKNTLRGALGGEFLCNWGAFESLSYYLGWDIKEFLSLKRQ